MSSPMISGSVGLLLEHQENLHGEENPLLASTMKALILHTAQEVGDHPGPDYGRGWGMMDTQRAAELMSEDALAGGESEKNLWQSLFPIGRSILAFF